MALSKTAKIWIIILSIPVVLVVVAIIAAKMYFTSERLKAMIIPEIEKSTHRSVSVNDISFSIFPSLAISLDGLRILNPAGSTFEKDEFLSLERLKLNVKLFELLHDKLEISYIIIDHPKVYLEITKNGMKNYSSSRAVKEGSEGVRVEKSETGELLLSNLEINDCEIEYIDKKFDSRMAITGLHQIAKVEAKPGEPMIRFEGTTSLDKLSYGSLTTWYLSEQPLTAESRLSYAVDKDVLTLDDVKMKLKDLPLTMTGTVSNLQQKTVILNLSVTSPGAEMTQLLSLVSPEMLKKTQGLSSLGDVKFSMIIKGESNETMNPGAKGEFTIANGKIQYTSLPKSINNINLTGSF